jgi:hypothetical protein
MVLAPEVIRSQRDHLLSHRPRPQRPGAGTLPATRSCREQRVKLRTGQSRDRPVAGQVNDQGDSQSAGDLNEAVLVLAHIPLLAITRVPTVSFIRSAGIGT